ncbi:AlpA family transcriptional regulator [Escherichia coli]|uniref:helix-turn-helix transcriptional regulator n=1 Tax=Escherichia coli TaxID=562 RepID=UPI002023F5EA|nr:AlpA family phage regulatory protein [Escherichia coli]
MSMIDIHSDQMVDMAFIVRFTGMTDKWFYKLIQEGKFPKPIKMRRSSRWLESEVVLWFKDKINESRIE